MMMSSHKSLDILTGSFLEKFKEESTITEYGVLLLFYHPQLASSHIYLTFICLDSDVTHSILYIRRTITHLSSSTGLNFITVFAPCVSEVMKSHMGARGVDWDRFNGAHWDTILSIPVSPTS